MLLEKVEEYPTLAKYFGLPWFDDKRNSNHVLWMRWNQGDRIRFVERCERALACLERNGLVNPKIVRMMKNADQFLDTIAQLEVAANLSTKGFRIELEANKGDRTTDIFLIDESVCIEVKNLHTDPRLVEQTLSGENRVVSLRDRLPSAVEGKYLQLPEGYPNMLVVVPGADVQFDEFEDVFIDNPRNKLGFFYQERVDGTHIHTKLGAVIMWKDWCRGYIKNPYADIMIDEDLLKKIIA